MQKKKSQRAKSRAIRNQAGATLAILSLVASANATQYIWTGNSSTVYGTAGNWSPSGPPGQGDIADFNTGQKNQTPTIAASTTVSLGEADFNTSGWTLNGAGTTAATASTIDLFSVGGIGILSAASSGTNDIGSEANIVLESSQTWEVATGGTMEVDSIISGAYSITVGASGYAGTLDLTGNNTFSGGITVVAGTLELAGSGQVNGGPITLNGSTLQLGYSAAISTSGGITIGANGATISSIPATVPNISAALSGSGALTFSMSGVNTSYGAATNQAIILSNANTGYTGAITVASGNLELGGTAGSINSASSLTLNGGGLLIGYTGGGTATVSPTSGIVIGSSGGAISAIAGDTVNITNPISGSGPLTLGTSFATNYFAAGAALYYSGAVNLLGANTFNGTLYVDNAAAQLAGPGTLLNVPTIVLNASGSLTINNLSTAPGNGGNVNGRLNSGANLQFGGGTLVYDGSDTANSSDAVGATTVVAGPLSTFSVIPASGTSFDPTFTLASLSRSAGGGVLFVNGTNLGSNGTSPYGELLVTAAPSLVGITPGSSSGDNTGVYNTQIVPFAVGEVSGGTNGAPAGSGLGGTATGIANTFVTYNPTTGLRPLNPTDEFAPAITAGDNVYLQATPSGNVTTTTSINSLVINGAANSATPVLTVQDGSTLFDASGALLFVTSGGISPSTSSGSLGFGSQGTPQEAIITVDSGATATVATPIAANVLTANGAGTLDLTAISSAFAGAVYINGTLQLGNGTASSSDGVLPNATSYNLSNNGALLFTDLSAQSISVPINYAPNAGGARFNAANLSFEDAGGLTLTSSATAPIVYVSGPLTLTSSASVNAINQLFEGYSNTYSPTYSAININGGTINTQAAYLAFNTSQPTANSYLGVNGGGQLNIQNNVAPASYAVTFYVGNYGDALVETGTLNGSGATGTINYATNSAFTTINSSTASPTVLVNAGTNSGAAYNGSQFSEINLYAGGTFNIGNQNGTSGAGSGGTGGLSAGFAAGQTFVLNVDGGKLSNMEGNAPIFVIGAALSASSAALANIYGTINLDSDTNGNIGRLVTGYLRAFPNTSASSMGATGAFLNFNGGELDYNDIANNGGLGASGNGGQSTATFLNVGFDGGVFVFANGAIIGSDGNGLAADTRGGTITIPHPLLAAQGLGLQTIAVPTGDGGSGYTSPPLVQITGGSGVSGVDTTTIDEASAVATITDGVITAITITNPGIYSSTSGITVSLIGGNPTTPASNATIAGLLTANPVNNTSGGLTKVEPGTLILPGGASQTLSTTTVPNSYTGPTTITAGTLEFTGISNATDAVIAETATTSSNANYATTLYTSQSTDSNNLASALTLLIGDISPTSSQTAGTMQINATIKTAGFVGFALANNQVLAGFGTVKGSSTYGLNIGDAVSGTLQGSGSTTAPLTGTNSVVSPGYTSSQVALADNSNNNAGQYQSNPYYSASSPNTSSMIVVGTAGNGSRTSTVVNTKLGQAASLSAPYATGALTLGGGTSTTTTLGASGVYLWKLDLANGGAGATATPGMATVSPGASSGAPAAGAFWDELILDGVTVNSTIGASTTSGTSNAFTVEAFGFQGATNSGAGGSAIPITGNTMPSSNYSWVISRVGQTFNPTTAATLLASLSLDTTNLPAPASGYSYFLSAQSDPGIATDTDLVVNYAPVPEPTALFLLAPAAGALLLRRRRRTNPIAC